MLSLFKKIFSAPKAQAYTTIQVKHMNSEISIFYKGKILTPNTDYQINPQDNSFSVLRFNAILDSKFLEVKRCFISYYYKKLTIQPWGYKKFKVHY